VVLRWCLAAPSNLSTSRLATRLPELVLIEVLRVHLSSAPSTARGWLAALNDPVLAPALSLIHGQPDHSWTVAELATRTAVSRSVLDDRFRQVLGRSPIATSPSGACTSRRNCSPAPTSPSTTPRDASDTAPKKRSAEHSNANAGSHPDTGATRTTTATLR
jgi:hypothetical protein